MLLFSLDVKFQVYEKICTKLLLINFNNVYGCILLVWTWVLYKGEYFCEHGMTGRISIARGHWNLVPLIFKNVSHVDFLLSSDSNAAAIPFRTFLRTAGARRAAALCHGLTWGFSFPHPTRNAREREQSAAAVPCEGSAARDGFCVEGKEHLLSPTCWMAAQPRGLEDIPHLPGVAAGWFTKWGEGWADQAFPLLEPVHYPAQP